MSSRIFFGKPELKLTLRKQIRSYGYSTSLTYTGLLLLDSKIEFCEDVVETSGSLKAGSLFFLQNVK
jgi:hypothetical protein